MALHKQGITASTNASYSVKERLATHILNSEEENIFQLSPSILASRFGLAIVMYSESSNNLSTRELLKKRLLKPIVF